jgi:hypothetical protein
METTPCQAIHHLPTDTASKALILAKMHGSKYPSLFDSCVGVVFLGTPHRGSGSFTRESSLLTAIAASSDLYGSLETGVLETMTSQSGSLLDVADDFITLCVEGGPKVACFFEQRSSKLGKVVGRDDIDVCVLRLLTLTFMLTNSGIHRRLQERNLRRTSKVRP